MKKFLKGFATLTTISLLFSQTAFASDISPVQQLVDLSVKRVASIESAKDVAPEVVAPEVVTPAVVQPATTLTAKQILLKANEVQAEKETFKFKGDINMLQTITIDGTPVTIEVPMSMEMQYKLPSEVYVKTATSMFGTDSTSEVYFDGTNMYMNSPELGEGWTNYGEFDYLTNLNSTTNLLTEEQIEFFEESFITCETVTKDGKAYYLLDVSVDTEGFKAVFDSLTGQIDTIIDGMLSDTDGSAENSAEIKAVVEKMLDSLTADIKYSYLVDAESFLIKDVTMNMDMSLNMEYEGSTMDLKAKADGSFEFYDYDMPITFPVIK